MSAFLRVLVTAFLVVTPAIAAAYETSATFTVKSNEANFGGIMNTLHLMLDRAGGRNRVSGARAMTRLPDENGHRVFSITLTLQEGDYIYVYVANVEEFVDLDDPNLNPDDVPDSNFFTDPRPQFPGYGGQYSTDNVYFVRDPNRPTFARDSVQPKYGALVDGNSIAFTVQANAGADGRALAGMGSANPPRIEVQVSDPKGTRYAQPPVVEPGWMDITPVTFSYNASNKTGTLSGTWQNPSEGFHLVRFHVSNDQGLAADPLVASVVVNRQNQQPVANAGPVRFAAVNQEVVLNGGMSNDPDLIGLETFDWRVIASPGGSNVSFRDVDEERIPRDGYGKGVVDEHGNHQGDPYPRRSAIPRFRADRPGDYDIGLRVTDVGGAQSPEVTTKVRVVQSFNAGVKVRLEPYLDGNDVVIDASLTTGAGAGALVIFPDERNPQSVSPSVTGLVARFPKPTTPGFYLFHAQVGGNSYHRSVMLKRHDDGRIFVQDYGTPPRAWREDKVMYLAFVREFFDSNNDGEGDFLGMIDKVTHIASLGVNAIWLMPVTPGPTTHGYAATAQFDAEEDYGTVEQYELLVETLHAFGIEVLMDLVANHTSAEHPFFVQGRANPDSPLHDLYAFNADGSYRYAFNFIALPDVDTNNPLTRRNIVDMVRFWMDRGVDGVRADIAGFTSLSLWEDVRYLVKSVNPEGVMLAELIPPQAEYFDQRFDLAYDSDTFWAMRDSFAGSGDFAQVDAALERAETFFSRATSARVRESLNVKDILFMRYLDNQDEDRFLLRAGNDLRRSSVGASVLMTLPGVPLVYYGDEVGIAELRGRMPFAGFSAGGTSLNAHYKKLILIRRHNHALRSQDIAPEGSAGNTYIRLNNNGDQGGGSVFSFLRHASHQRFIVLANRIESTNIGTQVRYYPPAGAFTEFPDGQVILVDHLNPTEQRAVTKAALLSSDGMTSVIPKFSTKIYQVTRFGIPDDDHDSVLDSYDLCPGLANADQADADRDDVGNACDACPATAPGVVVDVTGCPVESGVPRRRYALDGQLDDDGYEVAASGAHKLYASFNGRELYVATAAAGASEDVFIVVSEVEGVTKAAPFGKAGTVAFGGRFLADEGENDYADWSGATGQARAATLPVSGRGFLEGTLNLVEEFGAIPARLYISALRYGGGAAGTLTHQTPGAGGVDGTVTQEELFVLDLIAPELPDAGVQRPDAAMPEEDAGPNPVDAGMMPTDAGRRDSGTPIRPDAGPVRTDGDQDGDGLTDDRDNCLATTNADQADFDVDGVGDACDRCPVSHPSDIVDGEGCASGPPRTDGGEIPRPQPRLIEEDEPGPPAPQPICGCTTATSSSEDGRMAAWLGAVLLAWVFRSRRRGGCR